MPIKRINKKVIFLLLLFAISVLYVFNIPDNRNNPEVFFDNSSSNSIQNFLDNVSNSSTNIHVHPGESIQKKLNNASPGDVVIVYPGLYKENLVVNKSLVVISKPGESTETVIEAADPKQDVIKVIADNVTVCRLNLTGANISKAGIFFWGSNGIIYGNKLVSNEYGIYLAKSRNLTIENNSAVHNNYGIFLSGSSWNTLENNDVNENSYGIHLRNSTDNEVNFNKAESIKHHSLYLLNSSNNFLCYNRVSNNFEFKSSGLRLEASNYNNLMSNNISNTWLAVYLSNSSNNELSKNIISSNMFTIELYDSNNNKILDNDVHSNRRDEITLSNSRNNVLKGNFEGLFAGNKVQYDTNSTNNTIEG
jgi:parallel beta-helix repeat protein